MRNKILSILLIGFCLPVVAQEELSSDTFRIIKEYQPIIRLAKKISFYPEINDTLKLDADLNYSFIDKNVPIFFELKPIAAARIKGEPLVKLYNGYARLGIGNAMVPFGEVYYNNLRSKKFALGAHASYFQLRELNQIEGSDMSKAHVELFGKRFWKQNTLDAKLTYDRHNLNYYGFYQQVDAVNLNADDIGVSDSEIEQHYDRISAMVKLKSTVRDSFNLRHEGSLKYNLITNASGNVEHNIRGDFNLNQFRNSELYSLDILIDLNDYEFNPSNTIFALKPQISTIGDKFRINAGLGIYVNASSEADFHFYPIAEVKYNVIEDVIVPYIGVKGEIRRVNYNSITLENPFVAENIVLANSNEKFNLYAGIRGLLSSKVSFNVSASQLRTDNSFLYVQVPDSVITVSKDFQLTYDEIDETKFHGELVYHLNEKINVYAEGTYSNFKTKVEEEAWHRPNLKLSTSASYNLKNKIIIKLDMFYWGEQYARGIEKQLNGAISTFAFSKQTLDPIFDINLGFEYRYTKRLSAFIDFNNIGGINYEKYQNYPLQGFNVWGGLTYGF